MSTDEKTTSMKRLRLTLEAEGRPGLFELIIRAVGAKVGARYELIDLLAIGRQSFVFVAKDLQGGPEVVIKQPAFDYRRPIDYSRKDVARGRARLKREHTVLLASTTKHMPAPIALEPAPGVVPAAQKTVVLGGNELFLVEEYVHGTTLNDLGLSTWPSVQAAEREATAARIAREFVVFFRALQEIGWFYADLSASNLIIEKSGALRVVDAGSAVAIKDGVVVARGFTPAFTTPRLFEALKNGREMPATLAGVLPALAKVLHFALTKKEPLNGELPDLGVLATAGYSERCVAAMRAMLALDEDAAAIAAADAALAVW